MKIYEKLMNIQKELKAPKGQYNSFGRYKYRSCEDIFEAVKPLLSKNNVVLTTSDEMVAINERYYIKATVRITDIEDNSFIENTAYAREEAEKKGMDGSQITGASSSYARKYALNGLLLIDDTKDSDATNTGSEEDQKKKLNLIVSLNQLRDEVECDYEALLKHYKVTSNAEMSIEQLEDAIEILNKKKVSK